MWGMSPEDPAGPGPVGLRAARYARPRSRRTRRCWSWARTPSCRRRTPRTSKSGWRRSTSLSSATSSCPRPRALADVVLPSAQWAEEDGTMTNLEGRVLRRRQVRRAAGGRADRPRDRSAALAARARARRAAFRYVGARRVRRAAAGHRGRAGRLLGDHATARIDRERRRLLAVRPPTPPAARRGSSPIAFRRRTAARASTASTPSGPPRSRTPSTRSILTTGRVLAQYQSGTQTRRVRRLRSRAGAARPRCIRGRRSAPASPTATRSPSRPAAAGPRFALQDDGGDSRGHDLRAVPLGRTSSRPTG